MGLKFKEKIQYLDYWVLGSYVILTLLGIIFVYSASSDILLVNGFNPAAYGQRQIMFAVIGFIFGTITFFLDINVFKRQKLSVWLIGISSFLLAILIARAHFLGAQAAVNGAVGWIPLGPINIQPLEFAKLALIIYLAMVLDRRDGLFVRGKILSNLSGPILISGFIMAMVLVQPDTGGTAILGLIVLTLISMSGVPWRLGLLWFFGTILTIVVVSSIIVAIDPEPLQKLYQYQRFVAFVHPFKLEKTTGAQLVNSFYAIHNGGLTGVGIGNSMQKRGYLPEPWTDFILSIIAEEAGVLFAIFVIGLLFVLMFKSMEIGLHAHNQFNTLVCYGISTMIFAQTVFNTGGVLGLLPITGVTLPFVSYGGSSLIVLSVAIGLILNIAADEKKYQIESMTVK